VLQAIDALPINIELTGNLARPVTIESLQAVLAAAR
jgi:hypothetical protein